MAKYRKKPVVIEAFVPNPGDEWPQWAHDAYGTGDLFVNRGGGLSIRTLEGTLDVTPGDFIIRGVQGELYPCKPDIFEATYEPVEADDADV